jgi:hypothetical protein
MTAAKALGGFDGPLPNHHPAQYSAELLPHLARPLAAWGLAVHDPFAGPGFRLGALCDQLGLPFTGTEIVDTWVVGAVNQRPGDPRVAPGDSTSPLTYPGGAYAICTSPTYPNGMADDFKAKDWERRNTYRHAEQRARGGVDPGKLHPRNTGRYGPRRGESSVARYWALMRAAVRHWPDRAVVNVKDVTVRRRLYQVVRPWVALLEEHGYEIVDQVDVKTRGQREGANLHDQPVESEAVLTCERRS